jgi:ribosomal protein S18 acetylase RimI-like enzyme
VAGALSPTVARDYDGADDLRRMQRLVQDAWKLRGPKWAQHVGDLAWGRFQHVGREPEWRTRLWEHGGSVVAYGWVFEGAVLDFCVHPDRPELLDDVLDWAEACETDAVDANLEAIATLERRGFTRAPDAPFFAYLARDLDSLPLRPAPEGFTLRTVAARDVDSRVAAHRSAFDPSRVTVESYRNVMQAWPYRSDLDCVAVAPDGRVAAYCLAWLDDDNRAGELEPVGTHADFRRLGLAAAVCAFALRRLAEEHASRAVVYARGDDEYAAPKQLYESLGFRAHARTVPFVASTA